MYGKWFFWEPCCRPILPRCESCYMLAGLLYHCRSRSLPQGKVVGHCHRGKWLMRVIKWPALSGLTIHLSCPFNARLNSCSKSSLLDTLSSSTEDYAMYGSASRRPKVDREKRGNSRGKWSAPGTFSPVCHVHPAS